MQAPSIEARGAVMQLLSGYWYSQTLRAVAVLGVADALVDGPLTAEQLAARCGAHAPSLGRLMRAMATIGLFSFADQDRYANTVMSHWLRTDVDASLAAAARFGGDPDHWLAWGGLVDAVRTGQTAFEAVHGRPLFDRLGAQARDAALFQGVMAGGVDWNDTTVEACELAATRLLVDVGGGHGGLALAAAGRHPRLQAVVFDRPEVLATSALTEARPGAVGDAPADRCRPVAGDFFESVPAGADCYVLRFILHDWPDTAAGRILRVCRAAMVPGARLLVIERLMADQGPCTAAMLDVSMLVLTGGRERTRGQYARLLEDAGLRLDAVRDTLTGLSVLDAVAV